jgi:hypothetical protein
MTLHDSNSVPSDALNRAFELVSREFDGDLSDAETKELANFEANFAAEIAEFRKGCRRLRSVLQKIPVRSVKGSLWAVPEAASVQGSRTWVESRRGVAWATVAVVIVGCLLLAIVRPWSELSLSGPEQMVAVTDSQASLDAVPQNAARSLVAPSAMSAKTDASVSSDDHSESLTDTDLLIQPLLESTNWKIVVVQLDENDRDLAMQRIQSLIHDHGLRLQSATNAESSDFVGVVQTSAVSENDELVSAMEERVVDSRVSRDLSLPAEARRKEIIESIQNSLRHPTRSELHHGTVYVALSTARPNDISSPGSTVARSAAVPHSNDAKDSSSANGAEKLADQPIAAVTLVVFEFQRSPR